MLTIYLICFAYSQMHFSPLSASLALALFAVIETIAIIYIIHKTIRVSKRRWLSLLCVIILICCWVKWIPYFRWKDQTHIPEYVDKTIVNELPCSPCVFTSFDVGIPPFNVEPPYTYTLFIDSTDICEWIQLKTQDTAHYTYLIAYDLKIDLVTYNVWNGENYPFPWFGPIMYPDYKTSITSPNELIIYRIPKVAIWNE